MSGIGTVLAAVNLAARFPRVAGVLGAVPKAVWEALTVLGYLLALFALHQHYAHAAIDSAVKAAVTQRDAQWQGRFDVMRAKAQNIRREAESVSRKISSNLKEQHDAQVRSNAVDARDLQLRGPGKAAAPAGCRPVNHPGLPAAASGAGGPGGGGAAAAGPLPSNERLALVPWSWLVDQAQQADDSRSEVITWRNWYIDQFEAWEKMRTSTSAKH